MPSDHGYGLLDQYLRQHGLQLTPDGCFVRWLPTNPMHPRNWSFTRKTYDLTIINLVDLFVTACSTAGAMTARAAHREYGIDETLAVFIFVSVSLLGQLVGSITFAPYSEAFGRRKLYIVSSLLFSVGCIVIASVRSLAAVVIGRCATGFLSSIPANVLAGSIEDMHRSRQRTWWLCIWSAASNLGLVLGPITGAYISANLGWRWFFYIAAAFIGFLTILLLFIRESRPSPLLVRQVEEFRNTTGMATPPPLNPDYTPDLSTFIRTTLVRPVQLIAEPIVMCVGVMTSTAFGLVYLFTEALQPIYQALGFQESSSSLAFVGLGIGMMLSLLTRFADERIIQNHLRDGRQLLPEHKLLGMYVGTPLLAIGLWWFAWTIPPHFSNVYWIVPTIPLLLIGYALNEFPTVLLGYLADSYVSYAASGFAAVASLRAILSATFPLFAPRMFSGLGNNIAVSVLAAVATVFCAIPPLFGRYGTRIRANSKFAGYSLRTHEENCVDKDEFLPASPEMSG
ncbi:MFS multidrug transporter [Aspergillus alliaceus]|uniref:MFS multidrug transporter n=1 Tax=Petromyces alliaceus TaxID=209559 RepID=A0A5N7CI50_PETAA|nr:MFS multidrug transporter [Aspergillus alliaceus]KAB8231267.1 MFS multidrug transporter [Aspergillus alliaceus]KAE8393841.1 MFS multidrug transporter [Aspergillus alliaceus]